METIEILKQCTIEGLIIKLPKIQLDRNEYLEVKKSLELIGGSWKGGKTEGFVFKEDPTEYLEQLCSGEKRNLKKEFQFFGTPDALADRLVELAEITLQSTILEPSAGQGAIIKAINRVFPDKYVYCYELMPLNKTFLEKISTAVIIGEDFLLNDGTKYDCIIGNPPFSNNQDIDHVLEMYKCLGPHGRVVSIMSNHWRNTTGKKEKEFQKFIDDIEADVHEIEAGAFKESGTEISACIVVINKNDNINAPIFKQSTSKTKSSQQSITKVEKEVVELFEEEDNREPEQILNEIIGSIKDAVGSIKKVGVSLSSTKKSKIPPKPDESLKKFQDSFNLFTYRFGHAEVFIDFIDYSLLVFKWWDQKRDFSYYENKYKELYPKLLEMFIMLSEASDDMGEGFRDALGDLFMELVSGGQNGQFFTPDNICDMMSMITCPEIEDGQSILDPACGSARMLLAAAKRNRNAFFFGCDNDITCCKMAALNMLMNTMQGEVAHMDSLKMDFIKSYEISYVVKDGFNTPVYRVIENKDQSTLWQMHMNSFQKKTPNMDTSKNIVAIDEIVIPNIALLKSKKTKISNTTQLTLF